MIRSLMSNIATYIGESYSWIKLQKTRGTVIRDPKELVKWLYASPGSYLIFGTDVIPIELYDPAQAKSPLFDFLDNGGKVIWLGDIPFYYIEKEKGKKSEAGGPSSVPVNLNYLMHLPKSKDVRNTLLGDILEYKPKESWRPVNDKRVLPIALTNDNEASAWMFRIGRGYFIRLFDTPDISDEEEKYVLEFPEKFERIWKVNAIKLNNVRLFDNVLINLSKINVFIGDNGSGKTTILESVAILSGRLNEILASRNVKDYKTLMTTLRKNYLIRNYSIEGVFNTGQDFKYFLTLDVGNTFEQPIKVVYFILDLLYKYEEEVINKLKNLEDFVSLRKGVSELVKTIDDSFENVFLYKVDDKYQLFIEKSDRSLIRLGDLGKGLSSLILLSLLLMLEKPEILVIDDVESMGLFPLRLEILKKILDKLNSIILLSTQSIDVIAIFSRDDNVKFHLISGGKIKELKAEEVRRFFEANEDIRIIAKNMIYEIS